MKKTLILCLFSFAIVAQGNLSLAGAGKDAETKVLDATGAAELKALYFHQNLPAFLAECLIPLNPCGLSAQEFTTLRSVVESHEKEIHSVQIKFDAQMANPIATLPSLGSEIRIASRAIYTPIGLPEEMNQISALVLAARWAHVTAAPLPFLLKRSEEILASFEDETVDESVGGNHSPVTFYLSKFHFQKAEQVLLFMQDSKQSFELSELSQKALPCGSLREWQWTNVQSFAKANTNREVMAAVAVQGISKCLANRPQTLLIEMVVRDSVVLPEQIRISVREMKF